MTEAEAVELLEEWAKVGLQGAAAELKGKIVRRLGRLPLAIKLAGAQLQRQEAGQWLATFDARKLTARRVEDVHDSLAATFALSLDELHPDERRLYVALAIFREDEPARFAGIATLWWALDRRSGDDTRELLDDLAARALVERSQGDGDAILIHDLLRDFMAAELGEEGRLAAHRALVGAYRSTQKGGGWHTAPDDGYLYDHLAYHLDQLAKRDRRARDDLRGLFASQSWMHARVPQSGYLYDNYLADLDLVWRHFTDYTLEQIDDSQVPSGFADCVRYALIWSSVTDWMASHPPGYVAGKVETGAWSDERALGVVRNMTDFRAIHHMQRVQMVAAILATNRTKEIGPEIYQQLVDLALGDVLEKMPFGYLWPEPITNLVPHLSPEQRLQLFIGTRECSSVGCARTVLDVLARFLSADEIAQALEIAQSSEDEAWRVEVLAAFSPCVDDGTDNLARGEPRANRFASKDTRDPDREHRCNAAAFVHVLTILAPHLSNACRSEAVTQALAAVTGMEDEDLSITADVTFTHEPWTKDTALVALAPHLTPAQLAEAQAIAQAITIDYVREEALAGLAPFLAGHRRAPTSASGRVDAMRLREEHRQSIDRENVIALLTNRCVQTSGNVLQEVVNLAPSVSFATILDAIAASIIEICQEWEWL
jgi:hypothetical protein